MINFMVIALPRSSTTWAANWLTTDNTLCLHDALAYRTLNEIDNNYKTNKILGLSDTGVFGYRNKLNSHPAKKVILHRDIKEINSSLNDLGLAPIDGSLTKMLDDINGLHVHYLDLFNNPKPIWEHLMAGNVEFNPERHALLKEMQVQPEFANLMPVDKEAVKRYFKEIGE